MGLLRRQTNEMAKMLAKATTPKAAPRLPAEPLPEDYPKTPDGATKGIFEAWAKGDIASFVKNFGEPGAPAQVYDKIYVTLRSLVTRPTSTHSTTKMLPA